MANRRILIVGGYGTFGSRAAARLANDTRNEIIVAGRDLAAAERAAASLSSPSTARVSGARVDAVTPDLEQLRRLAPAVIYNASGPFQSQDYTLARAAIAIGAHYVDLADARAFVAGFQALDAEARRANVLAVSGASSVPGVSSAVIDHARPHFKHLKRISYGIVPANSFDPGVATTASILSYVGKPFTTRRDGRDITIHGWQGLSRRHIEGAGTRWFAPCDIPDLALFPVRYPEVETIDFKAGMEVPLMHFGLWGLSWLVRGGAIQKPERLAAPLLRLKRLMRRLGSEIGVMVMSFEGVDGAGRPLEITCEIVAADSHGPYIPQIPATAITRKLLDGTLALRGATACLGLVSLDDLIAETTGLAIEFRLNGGPFTLTAGAAPRALGASVPTA